MSMQAAGICPSCGDEGTVGAACGQTVCQRRDCRYIPSEFHDKLRAQAAGEQSSLVGLAVEEYLVVDRIGAGGFGEVLLALQLPIGMKAALKLIRLQGVAPERVASLLEKFEGEAKALAALTHPNIVRLLKYGIWNGSPYMVMEYVEAGQSMRALFDRSAPADLGTVQHVLRQILNALDAAHSIAIVHRDIKPDNILLQEVAGDPHHVKVLDFGLAKFVAQGEETSMIAGTPSYMAPEQIRKKGIGPWTDLYAVGVMAFSLLTGRRPFVGAELEQILREKLDPAYDPCRQLAEQQLPEPLLGFLRKALAAAPEERFREVASFRQALNDAIASLGGARGEPVAASSGARAEPVAASASPALSSADTVPKLPSEPAPIAPAQPLPKGAARARIGLAVGASVAAILALGAGGWWLAHRADSRVAQPDGKPAEASSAAASTASASTPPAADSTLPAAAPTPTMSPQELAEISVPSGWALVPPGSFQMGSPEPEPGRWDDEGPVHQVAITRPFLMKATEVTQGEWRKLMGNNPSPFEACGKDCPQVFVSWWEALAYANKLSLGHGYHECYALSGCQGKPGEGMECRSVVFKGLDCNGYRLPTEAEWEYAARAGTQSAIYSGSLSLPEANHSPELDGIAWYAGNSGVGYEGAEECASWPDRPRVFQRCGPHPVAQKTANQWGLFDMIGNVYEWCWDWKGPYPAQSATDPTGPKQGEVRVARGGNWMPPARKARAARRGDGPPGYRCLGLGLRLVRTAQ